MPRGQRKKSRTGIYHVIFRGINRQQIFEDGEDFEQFLYVLRKFQPVCGYRIFAYCLMPNHVHLLIKEGTEELGQAFRRIGASFVYWYNLKYTRTGHLFQDRFKSEVVEEEAYFLTVVRYIHRNPVKAGLCREPEEYRYSSYARYDRDPLIDSSLLFSLVNEKDFFHYQHISNEDECMEVGEHDRKRLTDQEAVRLMEERFHCGNPAAFQAAGKETQEMVFQMLRAHGGSLRQISRLTGASIGVIRLHCSV